MFVPPLGHVTESGNNPSIVMGGEHYSAKPKRPSLNQGGHSMSSLNTKATFRRLDISGATKGTNPIDITYTTYHLREIPDILLEYEGEAEMEK